jgi:hypothetical protein
MLINKLRVYLKRRDMIPVILMAAKALRASSNDIPHTRVMNKDYYRISPLRDKGVL